MKTRTQHGLSQDLETGCTKLAIVKFWGVQIFKGMCVLQYVIRSKVAANEMVQ